MSQGSNFVMCRSDAGDGGWSLHPPGASDQEIGGGDAPAIVSGPSDWDDQIEAWARPNTDDYDAAIRGWARP